MRRLVQLAAICALLSSSAAATQRLIVRDTAGQQALNSTCALLGCNVFWGLGDPAGQVFLIGIPDSADPNSFMQSLLTAAGVANAEIDSVLKTTPIYNQTPPPIASGLYDNSVVTWFAQPVWHGFTAQAAAQIVNVANAQSTYGVSGTGTVGIIDTGVDASHPVLYPAVVPGYDFTRNSGSGSELPDITQPTSPVINGVPPVYIDVSASTAVLDQSTVSVVDNGQYGAYGHGTMVAGIIHLVAPRASIMPLKAFQANGNGYNSDIVRAIYYGVKNGVRVFNLSFSTSAPSTEFERAVHYANNAGVICVAAAGNQNSPTPVYPAGYSGHVIAVASTDNLDNKSTFSNYGSWIWVAAPGEQIVTTYPWGTYAAASGTSFSTPFVAGTVSLLLQKQWALMQSGAASAVAHAKPVGSGLGNGRLDIMQAIQAVVSGQ